MNLPLSNDETKTTRCVTRGLWYDAGRGQWRVRLYRAGKAYFPAPSAYFNSYDEALAARMALAAELSTLPRTRKPTDTTDSLLSLWRQCVGAAATQRVSLTISAENIL